MPGMIASVQSLSCKQPTFRQEEVNGQTKTLRGEELAQKRDMACVRHYQTTNRTLRQNPAAVSRAMKVFTSGLKGFSVTGGTELDKESNTSLRRKLLSLRLR